MGDERRYVMQNVPFGFSGDEGCRESNEMLNISHQPSQTRHDYREELSPNISETVRDRTRLRLGRLAVAMGSSDGLWVLKIWWIDISKIVEEKGCIDSLTIKETSSS